MLYIPSKSRDMADENNKILTEWKWFETTVFSGNVNAMPIGMDLWYPLILESTIYNKRRSSIQPEMLMRLILISIEGHSVADFDTRDNL